MRQISKTDRAKALAAHKEREKAASAERIVVANYPYSHNPFIAHAPVEDCYAGCKIKKEAK